MKNIKSFLNALGKINESSFDSHAIELFNHQSKHNSIYGKYLKSLNIEPDNISVITEIPFMPIEFFKYHAVKTNDWQPELVFESSGTTQLVPSKHYINDIDFYHRHAKQQFENCFGSIKGKTIVALLPSYLEREGSSLVNMVNYFIEYSQSSKSGFYLNELDDLVNLLMADETNDQKFLFGVTFALLDLAEKYSLDLSNVTIIETGGMKGRREEILKEELYEVLRDRLAVKNIYSEYGMTELLSQAYGRNGKFLQSTSMKVLIRDINDPYNFLASGKTGGINIIDLANVHSCAFIETKDLGKLNEDNTFEVLGRFDNSDIRGCNLLVG